MSLYFNWDRLDQTAAEALRLLVNEKLAALVREMRGASSGPTSPHAVTSATASVLRTPNRSTSHHSGHTRAAATAGSGNASSLCSSPVPPSNSAQVPPRFVSAASPANPAPATASTAEGKSHGGGGGTVGSADAEHDGRAAGPAFVIEELAVTNFEWGAVPPFVELVQFQDAIPLDATPCMTIATPHAVPSSSSASSAQFGFGEAHRMTAAAASMATPNNGSSSGNVATTVAPSAVCAGPRETSTPQSLVMHTPQPAALVEDRLAPLLGPGGLFVRLHITYGGTMRVTVATRVRYEVRYGPIALPVRMSVALHATDLDFDGYLCLNLHQNACRLWLEPGEPTASPISRMSMTAVFGGGNGDDETDNELVSSSMEYNSWYESLTTEEEDESVFSDDKVIARFVLDTVSDVMRRKIIAPHYVTIPISFAA